MNSLPILSVQSVSKSYGTIKAVSDISLDIPKASIYGFLGPNGAGKTTTIRSIMGILMYDSGKIMIDGQPLTRDQLDRVGYLPEERGLYRKMKCIDQLVFLAELKSVPRKVARKRAEEWLERLELSDWAEKKVDALSKGMQQKIQLAATFLPEPELVILDEPFSGLDPINIELLRNIILEERNKGCTVIFSTHILAEAEKICDSICLIEAGKKVLDGNLEKIRREYPLKTVKVIYHNEEKPPEELPGVESMELKDGVWKLAIDSDTDTDLLLDKLRKAGKVDLFSANRPSLEEIFLNEVHQLRQEFTA